VILNLPPKAEDHLLGAKDHRFSSKTLSSYPHFLKYFLLIKKAAFSVNAKEENISSKKQQKFFSTIDKLLKNLSSQEIRQWFSIDPLAGGGGVLVNREINYLLSELTGFEVNFINKCQSTADTCASALRLSQREKLKELDLHLNIIVKAIAEKEKESKKLKKKMMARTCLQDAFETDFSSYLQGLRFPLENFSIEIKKIDSKLCSLWLGGTVIGDGNGATSFYKKTILPTLSELVGVKLEPRKSFYDAAQNSYDIIEIAHLLDTILIHLSKISQDIRLLASGPKRGFNDIQLKKVMVASSFFGDEKNNPTIFETMILSSIEARGLLWNAKHAATIGELNLNVFDLYAGLWLNEAIDITNRFIPQFAKLGITGIQLT
jgi:aspartate ammonia-lyase